MRLILLVLLTINIGFAAKCDINKLLFELPDVVFEKIKSSEYSNQIYKLYVKQPLDHDAPSKGYFYQKVYLTHKGFNLPTVINTAGYATGRNYILELTSMLKGNQIRVEHRFFGESMPDSLQYEYLNLKQATADLHRIRVLFNNIYTGKWVSTGISKGGATTIFYRYFYPNDVDVSVPYVAPINREFEEKRIYSFLNNVGPKSTREKLLAFQKRILTNREKLLPLLRFYALGAKLKFNLVTLEQAFEFAVLEYPFSFWQWGHSVEDIPSANSSDEEALKYLLKVSGINFYGEKSMKRLVSHYYQSIEEMGYYGFETAPFKGLLKALPMQPHPYAAFVPEEIKPKFDGALLNKINAWLPEHGHKFLYIYGELDTWSASAVPVSKEVDAHWFTLKGQDHGGARIKNMSKSERAKFVSVLENWLEIEIE